MRSLFLGNWVTRCYIVAVLATAASSSLPSAKIALITLAAPVAVIFAPIYLLGTGWMTTPMLIMSVTAGVLLNTLVLNTIVGHAPAARHPPTARHPTSKPALPRHPTRRRTPALRIRDERPL